MNILTGYDFGNTELAEYDAFFKGRSLIGISKIPYAQFVDISLIEDNVYTSIVSGSLEIGRDPVARISNQIEKGVKLRAKYMKDVIEASTGSYDDRLLDAIGDALFERNSLYVTYQGISSEVGPVTGLVDVLSYVETLSERGKTLSKNEQFHVQGWYSRNLLAPANGLLQTHTRLLYRQEWTISFEEVEYKVIAYKDEESDGVLVYNQYETVGLFPLSMFTEDWVNLIGNR